MAQWNSDGYIFIDFKDVNFSLTNQTVSGIYQRMVDIVGTNKFILVLNANGRTPMPGTISLTNGQYVIDTVLYMFSISSNDNLFIRRQDIPAGDIIDDENITISSTYSSYKIDNTYQKILTAGDNIAISDENVISATDTTYTAGTNVTISDDNVISATDTTYTAGDNVSISEDNVISATDTTYTAGDNVSISEDNVISATDTTYTAGDNVYISEDNVISATDTTYTAGSGLSLSGTEFSIPAKTYTTEYVDTVSRVYAYNTLTTTNKTITTGDNQWAFGYFEEMYNNGRPNTVVITKDTSNPTDTDKQVAYWTYKTDSDYPVRLPVLIPPNTTVTAMVANATNGGNDLGFRYTLITIT